MSSCARSRLRVLLLRCSAAICLIVCVGAWPALAQQSPPGDFWRWAHFTTADGLPSNQVTGVVETHDGTLWALTRGDVAFYDGYRWNPVPLPAEFSRRVTTIVPLPERGIALLASGQLLIGDGAGFRVAQPSAGGRPPIWNALAATRKGSLLLDIEAGVLYEWDGSSFRRHAAQTPFGRVFSLRQAGPTTAWVSADRGLFCWDGTIWRQRMVGTGQAISVWSAAELSDESAWAYVMQPLSQRGLWRWDARSANRPVRHKIPGHPGSIAVTRDGDVIAAHNTGELTLLGPDGWVPLIARRPDITDVQSIGLRANGDICVATDHGLFISRQSAARWTLLSFPSADGRNGINDIARTKEGMWLATSHGLEFVPRGSKQTRHIDQIAGEELGAVTGVLSDQLGRVWVSSGASFVGVRWLDAAGWHRLDGDALLSRSYVHRIVEDSTGAIWFLGIAVADGSGASLPPGADGPGAFRLKRDGGIERWGEPEGLISGRVYALAEAPDGAWWFGTGRGVSRRDRNQWTHFGAKDGLKDTRIFTLAVDAAGVVYVGHQHGSGLGMLQGGAFIYMTTADGLASDEVAGIYPEGDRRLWVASRGGLSLLEGGNWTTFDLGSGLRSSRVWPVVPAGNRVYVGTNGGGLAVLNLANPEPPPIVVATPPVARASDVQVGWRAFSWWGELASSDVPTRVRIDDAPWSAWSEERAWVFRDVTPGLHTIGIQAKGLLGHAGRVAAVSVTIDPPFYARPAFVGPVVILGATVVVLGVSGALRRRKYRRELQERERRFSRIFHSSPLAAAISSMADGQVIDINEAFVRTFGYARDEMIGRRSVDVGLWPKPQDRDVLVSALSGDEVEHAVETALRCKSGEIADVIIYAARLEIGGQMALLTQTLDVTAQRRLESQLRQSHKMESVGRLAGGIAHDFNNLLTVIMGNASLLNDLLTPGDERREEVDQIRMAAERAEKLTRQLLAFARKQVLEPRAVNLNDLVLKTDRMLRRVIGAQVELVTILTPEPAIALVDPQQIEQVLINMAVNARDAMPDGGMLTIRTANIDLAADNPQREPDTTPGRYVRLSVLDTGGGMEGHVASHVFDPFFTTKEAGKGTGLGLATCFGIVKQARGQIKLETSPGCGAAFYIDLPAAASDAIPTEPPIKQDDLPGGGEHVLLVEDEGQVRRLAASLLRQRGYHVSEAASGTEALQFESQHNGQIDILVTDVVMPQMRGTELVRCFRERRPDAKILFMSGYTDDQSFHENAGLGTFGFLAKPFTPSELARAVRDQLDGE